MILINGVNENPQMRIYCYITFVTYIVTRKCIFMSKVHPKQHFMPQFLQRNFSDNKKTVYSYIHNHGIIKQVNISSHMQNRNDFDEKTEKLLSRLESNASIEIQKMIDDPINYQRQNPTLPDSVIQFLISMNNRSPDTFNKYKKYVAILRTIMQSKIESEPDKQWFEFYDEILFSNCDTPEHHSALVNSTDIDPQNGIRMVSRKLSTCKNNNKFVFARKYRYWLSTHFK